MSIKTEQDLKNKITDFIVANATNDSNAIRSLEIEISNFLKSSPTYSAKISNLQNMVKSELTEKYKITEQDLINKIKNKIVANKNKDVTNEMRLIKEINVHLYFNQLYRSKITELEEKASELAISEYAPRQASLSRESLIKNKINIYISEYKEIINPSLKNSKEFIQKKTESENILKRASTDVMNGLINEANDRSIIYILRDIKEPDLEKNSNLIANNNLLISEINNLSKTITTQRDSIIKNIKAKQNQINQNNNLINEYNARYKYYNTMIAPKLPQISQYINNTFGSYFSGSKKDELSTRSNSAEVIQLLESYENIIPVPLNHIGVM